MKGGRLSGMAVTPMGRDARSLPSSVPASCSPFLQSGDTGSEPAPPPRLVAVVAGGQDRCVVSAAPGSERVAAPPAPQSRSAEAASASPDLGLLPGLGSGYVGLPDFLSCGVGPANFRLSQPLFSLLTRLAVGWVGSNVGNLSLLTLRVGGCPLVEGDGDGGWRRLGFSLSVLAVGMPWGERGRHSKPTCEESGSHFPHLWP